MSRGAGATAITCSIRSWSSRMWATGSISARRGRLPCPCRDRAPPAFPPTAATSCGARRKPSARTAARRSVWTSICPMPAGSAEAPPTRGAAFARAGRAVARAASRPGRASGHRSRYPGLRRQRTGADARDRRYAGPGAADPAALAGAGQSRRGGADRARCSGRLPAPTTRRCRSPTGPMRRGFLRWLADTRNDLEHAAMALVPEVGTVLDALGATDGCRFGPDERVGRHMLRCIHRSGGGEGCGPAPARGPSPLVGRKRLRS